MSKGSMGVVEQVRAASRRENLLPLLLGFVLGGFVPLASFFVAHHEVAPAMAQGKAWYAQLGSYFVAGALIYSAKTVFSWGRLAFQDTWKALGFVALVEGVMITSSLSVLGWSALAILVAINGIATGCNLALASMNVGRSALVVYTMPAGRVFAKAANDS